MARHDGFHDCWGFHDHRPWYTKLWQWFFPLPELPPFTSIKVPMCFYTHTKREDLVKIICGDDPKTKT